MNNFDFHNPTQIVFGKGTIAKLAKLVPQNARVLVTSGGGSIKKNGVRDQVLKALSGRTVFEFEGIEPNPEFETCMKAVELVKREKVDFLLAVGGGSVLDGTKFIGAAARYPAEKDPWSILLDHGARVKEDVYRPDWLEEERLVYTDALARILATLLPTDLAGSVSTVPGCFRPRAREDRRTAEARLAVRHARPHAAVAGHRLPGSAPPHRSPRRLARRVGRGLKGGVSAFAAWCWGPGILAMTFIALRRRH